MEPLKILQAASTIFILVLTGCYAQIVLFIVIPAKVGIYVWIGIELAFGIDPRLRGDTILLVKIKWK